jgi:protein-tyrosine phosphatase
LNALHEVIEGIKRDFGDGKAILVHCSGGRGRSGMVTAAYLISQG